MERQDRLTKLVGVFSFLLLVLLISTGAISRPGDYKAISAQRLAITADAADAQMDATLVGGCLYGVEIKCTDDDALTFTLNSGLGSELYTVTTTGAIAGEVLLVDNYFPITRPMTYTVSGYSDNSGCVVEVTTWQK